jgi:acetoin utilization protein AcuB
MTPDPTTIDVSASLDEASQLMRSLHIRHLPVLDRGRLAGILTQTDLMRALPSPATTLSAWEIPALLEKARAREAMTPDPLTVTPDTAVEDAARLLRDRKISSLLVTENGILVGIVTSSDLFGALIYLLGGDITGVRLSVELPNGAADLAGVAAALAPLDTGRAVTLTARFDAITRRADIRVATSSPLLVAERLAEAGYHVHDLRLALPRKSPSNTLHA